METIAINNTEFNEDEILALNAYMKRPEWAFVEKLLQSDRNVEVGCTLNNSADVTLAQFCQAQGAYSCLMGLSALPVKIGEAAASIEFDRKLKQDQ